MPRPEHPLTRPPIVAALALLICASTVFVKQHSVLDIFVAIPWSLACGWIIYRPRRART